MSVIKSIAAGAALLSLGFATAAQAAETRSSSHLSRAKARPALKRSAASVDENASAAVGTLPLVVGGLVIAGGVTAAIASNNNNNNNNSDSPGT
ncbi:MAG: hypothetical protein RIS94_2574 [Pseudomonadota bacterium]|jgi:predicted sugar kinase